MYREIPRGGFTDVVVTIKKFCLTVNCSVIITLNRRILVRGERIEKYSSRLLLILGLVFPLFVMTIPSIINTRHEIEGLTAYVNHKRKVSHT
jgi:hypothetical protein